MPVGVHHQTPEQAESVERARRSTNAARVTARVAAEQLRESEDPQYADAVELLEQASSFVERAQLRLGL
jgi:hypothetical protein